MRKPCCDKQQGPNKGAWSKQEDQKLIDYIRTHGEGCWRSLAKAAGLQRCGKSCRLRWINYLRPDIKHGDFGQDEEDLIIKFHALLGNRWSLIAGRLPGRTDNEVKNYWNSHIRTKLIKMGIDPNNHKLQQHQHQSFPKVSYASAAATAPSSNLITIMNKEQGVPFIKSNGSVEEAASMVSSSSQLNLDLTIAFPSPRNPLVEDKSKPSSEFTKIRKMDEDSPTTLPLFQ